MDPEYDCGSGADCSDYDCSEYSDDDCSGYIDDDCSGYIDEDDTATASACFASLSKAEIEQRQEDIISEVSSVISVPRPVAIALLVSFKWRSDLAQDQWVCHEEEMRRSFGLTVARFPKLANRVSELECKICFDRFSIPQFTSLDCGHSFCNACWSQYVKVSIDDGGVGCLTLRCPEPKCPVLVGQSTVKTLIRDDGAYIDKYSRLLRRSYIEAQTDHKWCPAPDCENAVRFEAGEKANYDVVCDCSHEFCFNCTEDAHRPVDCPTVGKWMLKNSSESENVNWVLANTKPCPKCRTAIEKNQGCNHMTCKPPCKFQFCWLCLVDWTKHNESTGGFYSCNTYEKKKQAGDLSEEESRRESAKQLVDKYAHYFERWASNRNAKIRAMDDLNKLQSEHFESLSSAYRLTDFNLDCVRKAWMQIKECRRVLEWTYAAGYYLEEGGKKTVFEFVQGEAEASLERLHNCAEKEIMPFIEASGAERGTEEEAEAAVKGFHEYSLKLQQLTSNTGNYFEKLVSWFENGMDDVEHVVF